MTEHFRKLFIISLAVVLGVFTVIEVNLARLDPLSQLAVFAMLGLSLCFLHYPAHRRLQGRRSHEFVNWLLVAGTVVSCSYLIVEGDALGRRAGNLATADVVVGLIGIALVLEATRRAIGSTLPLLALAFLVYGLIGPFLPDWAFPHRGYDLGRLVAQTFLRTEGVFGTALRVMFTYVFLFVVFGAFLEAGGTTQYIIDLANRVFGKSPGGPAKVGVLGSGLMGSLSGSAVANAVTTGTFTIPMMRSAGFKPHIAGGITAAAASGGALVPPVMGAGAYMMLEIVDPPVTFLEIARAAVIPAVLYYFSIFMIVHFFARRIDTRPSESSEPKPIPSLARLEGVIFFSSLGALVLLLILGYSPFRAVTYSLFVIVGVGVFKKETRIGLRKAQEALVTSARNGVALIAASACVGIIIGVVTLTGVGTAFPNTVVPLAEQSLFLALLAIMLCSIMLGMGLPSAVCYLLMATLIGPVLNRLGVIPLAAHLFIFYFGMMSMVTPPVALAAYASASISESKIMPTALAAFRFSLVGFSLPFMFVYRPELLLLTAGGETAAFSAVVVSLAVAVMGIIALAGAIAGYLFGPVIWVQRLLFLLSAVLLLFPGRATLFGQLPLLDTAGTLLFAGLVMLNYRESKRRHRPSPAA